MAGDDRHDRRVTLGSGRGDRAGEGGFGVGGAGHPAQPVQVHVQDDLGGLAGAVGQAVRRDEQAAGFFEGVVLTLPPRPQVLRARALAERVQHRRQRRSAGGGQVAAQGARAAERGLQAHRPVIKPVVGAVGVGLGGVAADLFGEAADVGQVHAAARGGEQDRVGVVADLGGDLVGPRADLARPGRRRSSRRPGRRGRGGGRPGAAST